MGEKFLDAYVNLTVEGDKVVLDAIQAINAQAKDKRFKVRIDSNAKEMAQAIQSAEDAAQRAARGIARMGSAAKSAKKEIHDVVSEFSGFHKTINLPTKGSLFGKQLRTTSGVKFGPENNRNYYEAGHGKFGPEGASYAKARMSQAIATNKSLTEEYSNQGRRASDAIKARLTGRDSAQPEGNVFTRFLHDLSSGSTPRRAFANLFADAFGSSQVSQALGGAFGIVMGGMALQIGYSISQALMKLPQIVEAGIAANRFSKTLGYRGGTIPDEWQESVGRVRNYAGRMRLKGKDGKELDTAAFVTEVFLAGQAQGSAMGMDPKRTQALTEAAAYQVSTLANVEGIVDDPAAFTQAYLQMKGGGAGLKEARTYLGNLPQIKERLKQKFMAKLGWFRSLSEEAMQATLQTGGPGITAAVEDAIKEVVHSPLVAGELKGQAKEFRYWQDTIGWGEQGWNLIPDAGKLPKETRDYVNRIRKSLDENAAIPGAPRKATFWSGGKMSPDEVREYYGREDIQKSYGSKMSAEQYRALFQTAAGTSVPGMGPEALSKPNGIDIGAPNTGLPFAFTSFAELFDKMQLEASGKNLDFDIEQNTKRIADNTDKLVLQNGGPAAAPDENFWK
jgi:hypothetical protein